MTVYRFTLQPYRGRSTRYNCPSCGAHRRFSRYVDTATGNYIDESVGKCDRVDNCGYHFTPKQFFESNPHLRFSDKSHLRIGLCHNPSALLPKSVSYIPETVLERSLRCYGDNHLVSYLSHRFGADAAQGAINQYRIGTSSHWSGATVFWQIDKNGAVRTGKVMLYNPENGKRVKEPFSHINWVHSILKIKGYNLQQCLFGEHLLAVELSKPVAIVESEKTAIIASIYLPQFVWLATGGLNNLTVEKCAALKERNVVLFPDVNSLEQWRTKAQGLSAVANVMVSNMLERRATEADRIRGADLADYLVQFEVEVFNG